MIDEDLAEDYSGLSRGELIEEIEGLREALSEAREVIAWLENIIQEAYDAQTEGDRDFVLELALGYHDDLDLLEPIEAFLSEQEDA